MTYLDKLLSSYAIAQASEFDGLASALAVLIHLEMEGL